MSPKFAKIGLSVLVLGAAFGGLFYTTLAEGTEYYKHVEEVMVSPEPWYGKRLQLHGYVTKDSIRRKRESLDYRFTVESKGHTVQASYTGVVPDTFKDGAEVVLKGRLGPHGFVVEPDGVMAKCPSKYDASPNAPVAQAGPRKARGHRVVRYGDGQPRSPGAARRLRRRELRGDDLRRRRPAALDAAHRQRGRRAVARLGAPRPRLDRADLGVRVAGLQHQVRRRQLRRRAAALLPGDGVLGRARRLDSLLGGAAVDLRGGRHPRQPRDPARADSLRRRDRRRRWRCSSSS